jgi:hypothetical protein
MEFGANPIMVSHFEHVITDTFVIMPVMLIFSILNSVDLQFCLGHTGIEYSPFASLSEALW